MDDKRIHDLANAAAALDQLESDVAGRQSMSETPPWRRRRLTPWRIGVVSVAAALALLLWPRAVLIERVGITPILSRGASAPIFLVTVELNRPAHVRVVLIGERYEPVLMPLDLGQTEYIKEFEESVTLHYGPFPDPSDPSGFTGATAVMIVASEGTHPTPVELATALPDRIAPEQLDHLGFRRALRQLAATIETAFDCDVASSEVSDACSSPDPQ